MIQRIVPVYVNEPLAIILRRSRQGAVVRCTSLVEGGQEGGGGR